MKFLCALAACGLLTFPLVSPAADAAATEPAAPTNSAAVTATTEHVATSNAQATATTPPSPAGDADNLLADAIKLKAADNLTEARAKGLEALKAAHSDAQRGKIEELLNEIAAPLIFSKRPLPEKVEYTVVTGDSLALLAKKFGTTVEVIRKGNKLPGQVIRLGTRLRILNGTFKITVSKTSNTLLLTLNDQYFKRYRVGTGQYSTTPTGTFKITDKVAQPTWYRPDGKSIPFGDKENLLGTHWMSIDVPGFGLHGTWEPDTVGKQSSQGCIRLVNADIEELFTFVPEGTPVTIQD